MCTLLPSPIADFIVTFHFRYCPSSSIHSLSHCFTMTVRPASKADLATNICASLKKNPISEKRSNHHGYFPTSVIFLNLCCPFFLCQKQKLGSSFYTNHRDNHRIHSPISPIWQEIHQITHSSEYKLTVLLTFFMCKAARQGQVHMLRDTMVALCWGKQKRANRVSVR